MHYLVENYADCGLDKEIEAVKREWWNVVMENSWEYVPREKKDEKEDKKNNKKKKKNKTRG